MQIGRDADMQMGQMGQRCRWGRYAEGQRCTGAERQICRYTERYVGRKRQRDMGEREGDRETIPAICTDRHTGNYTIIDTDQRQSH